VPKVTGDKVMLRQGSQTNLAGCRHGGGGLAQTLEGESRIMSGEVDLVRSE
jgi:hypothetical protein